MLVRRVRRALPLLLAACLALSLAACTGDTEDAPPTPVAATASPAATPAPTREATPAPTPTATPSATPTAVATQTATPTPTATPSPTPTATATPSPTPTPTPTPTPAPTATPSPTPSPSPTPPSPTPTATPAPLVTAEDLGIREVDTAEALAAAGLTHARYAAGEAVPWDPGLFLLAVESGEVEAWVRSLAALSEDERSDASRASADLDVSPSNRFVSWAAHGMLYDRHTERTFALDSSMVEFDRWWGTGFGERLLFRLVSSGAFVAMDTELRPVARLELPPGERFTSPNGGYILVRECVECEPGDRFHLVNLEDEANPTVHSWELPWRTVRYRDSGDIPYRIELLDGLVAFIADTGRLTCRVARYDLRGTLLSDVTIPGGCYEPGRIGALWSPLHSLQRISPDGRLLAVATSSGTPVAKVFDAATGEEVLRVKGVYLPWSEPEPTGVWLADSSGIVVRARRGTSNAAIDGEWRQAPGRPAPDDPDRFFSCYPLFFYCRMQVTDHTGEALASFSFGVPSAPIPDPPYQAALVLDRRANWGATSDTLRTWTTFFHVQGGEAPSTPPDSSPVIERPPFEDRLLVEVVVDTCLNLREEHSLDASIITCLPSGTVVETDDYYPWDWRNGWFHLRTPDGLEGWASAEYLRWHSNGVRLEE